MKLPVIKSIFQAEAWSVYAVKRINDYRKEHGSDACDSETAERKQKKLSEEKKQEILEGLKKLQSWQKRLGEILYAHPLTRHLMHTWMVDVKGAGGFGFKSESKMKEALEELADGRKGDFISRQGALPKSIHDAIVKAGFHITDAGGGCGGWHIGVPGNDTEADRFCDFMHWKFKKAIEVGMIRIHKMFWGYPRLYNLRNEGDCEKWIKKHGDPVEVLKKEGFEIEEDEIAE